MSSPPIALVATSGTDASWTVTVTWPAGWETSDLADCPAIAFAAGHAAGCTRDEALLWADLDDGITVEDETHATIAIANDAWPTTCPASLAWGLVVQDAQGREVQVASGRLSVSPRTPSGAL